MEIVKIEVGAFDVNCFLIENGDEMLVVDPGDESSLLIEHVRARKMNVTGYLLTHGHMDHISGLAKMADEIPAPIYMHADDLDWGFREANQIPPYYPVPQRPASKIETFADGDEPLGKWNCRIIHTPGHTPGSVCLHFPDDRVLVSGDTLFQKSVGRTDLPGGDARQLSQSLLALAQLPRETKVYPGHGPTTTIGYELENNYFMRPRSFRPNSTSER